MKVGCNIHPWMGAYIVARKDPYAAVSDKDGKFEIKDLPAGKELEFRLWQENVRLPEERHVQGGQGRRPRHVQVQDQAGRQRPGRHQGSRFESSRSKRERTATSLQPARIDQIRSAGHAVEIVRVRSSSRKTISACVAWAWRGRHGSLVRLRSAVPACRFGRPSRKSAGCRHSQRPRAAARRRTTRRAAAEATGTGWGTLKGTFMFAGTRRRPARSTTKDTEVCDAKAWP